MKTIPRSLHPHFNELSFLNPDCFSQVDGTLGKHHPEVLVFRCWDARMDMNLHNLGAGKVLLYPSAGATLPENVLWDPNLSGMLSLADYKSVRQYLIKPHSDCLAANLALKNPDIYGVSPQHPHYHNLVTIHASLSSVGVDLHQYAERSWDEARGDEAEATNLMAKRLSIASLANLMSMKIRNDWTKTVGQAVIDKEVNVAVVFADFQKKRFEYLSLDTKEFHPFAPEQTPAHMCVRHNGCEGCSCDEQVSGIADTIQFFPALNMAGT